MKSILAAITVGVLLCGAFASQSFASPKHLTAAPSHAWTLDGPFEERLIAQRQPAAADRQSLEQAIAAFAKESRRDDPAVFWDHLKRFPESAYRASLLTNLGLHHYSSGYFSKAIDTWEMAWRTRGDADDSPARLMVDRGVGELIRMHARLGRTADLERLMKEVQGRPLAGQATEAVAGAKEGLWQMHNAPGVAFLCGPMSLRSLVSLLHPEDTARRSVIEQYRSGPKGVTLQQVEDLSRRVEMNLQPVVRESARVEIPVPSVIHWKVNHYAAIVGFDGHRYHIKDPTFGQDLYLTRDAIDAESSGYFMVPGAQVGDGWRVATAQEKSRVHGMGFTTGKDQNATSPSDKKGKDDKCTTGCASYNVHSMLVSLNIEDTPVAYRPLWGPRVDFRLTYNQREASLPDTPNYGNVGRKWTHNWLSFIRDNPGSPSANVFRATPGGGGWSETGFNASTSSFTPSKENQSVLTRVSTSPIQYELANPDGSRLVYGHSDQSTGSQRRVFLTQMIDPQGNAITLGYDAQNRLTTITDAAAKVSTLEYTSAAAPLQITRFTDPAGRSALITYDGTGRLQSITDAVGMVSSFDYTNSTNADFVSAMTTPYGTTTFKFFESGERRWLVATDPMGRKERFEFTHTAPLQTTENPAPSGFYNYYMQYRNSFYWNKRVYSGVVNDNDAPDYSLADLDHWLHTPPSAASRILESKKKPLERRVWYSYLNQSNGGVWESSTSHQPSSTVRVLPDGTDQIVRHEYNAQGNVTRVIDPAGRDVYYDYAGNGLDITAVRRKTSSGAYTTEASYTYNTAHRPLTFTDAAGKTTTYTYDGQGRVLTITNPLSQVTTYAHDDAHGATAVYKANGAVPVHVEAYDGAGNVIGTADSQLRQVTYEHDGLNRKTRATYPDGTTEAWSYDRLDLASYTNRLGVTTTYTYNANRELVGISQPVSGSSTRTVAFSYDPDGLLNTYTDGLGKVTTWERDIQGRVTRKTYADGKGYTLTYDETGRLKTRTDARGQVSTWGYTKDDRAASISVANAAVSTPASSFVWDNHYPRITSMTDALGTTGYTYVAPGTQGAGQLLCDSGAWSSTAICYTYDALGRRSTRTVQAANDTDTSSWAYDALGRVASETLGKLGTFTYEYLGATEQITKRTNPLNVATTFEYELNEGDRRLKKIAHGMATGPAPHVYSYVTDALGQVTEIQTGVPGVTSLKTEGYLYDEANRLTHRVASQVDAAGGNAVYALATFANDAGDNFRGVQGTASALNETPFSVTVNDLNQATSHTSAVVGSAYPITYDDNGNRTSDRWRTMTWDGLDRLASATTGSTTSTWAYDGLNRRGQTSSGGTVRRYRWCGDELCAILDGSNQVRSLLYGQRGEYTFGQKLLFSEDHLGSVRHINDGTTGAWVASFNHDSYGAPQGGGGCAQPAGCLGYKAGRFNLGYAGLYYDAPTGLYLGTYRAYDAETGRWISRDPIEESGGLNIYQYADGEPVSLSDPLGLASEHTKNARPSTQSKHEAGQSRKQRDAGNEKGDKSRSLPRQRPPGTKGPWPPKSATAAGAVVGEIIRRICLENPGMMECRIIEPGDDDEEDCNAYNS